MPIVITTPTGHIGSALVRELLGRGRSDLRLLLRDASRLDADVRQSVETREGALQDAAYVREATAGADALFWLSPPGWAEAGLMDWYETLGDNAAAAVRANGIGHVVHLSSEGAQDRDRFGPVSGLGRVEDRLDAVAAETGASVRHLRPTFFFENFEQQPIAQTGQVFFPAPTSRTTGMIATADIAAAAADLLADRSWAGTDVVHLFGPRDLSYDEAAAVLSEALGRDVTATQVPPDAVREQFRGMGAPDDWVEGFVALYTSIGAEGYRGAPRDAASTTPTTLEEWARRSLRPTLESETA